MLHVLVELLVCLFLSGKFVYLLLITGVWNLFEFDSN